MEITEGGKYDLTGDSDCSVEREIVCYECKRIFLVCRETFIEYGGSFVCEDHPEVK